MFDDKDYGTKRQLLLIFAGFFLFNLGLMKKIMGQKDTFWWSFQVSFFQFRFDDEAHGTKRPTTLHVLADYYIARKLFDTSVDHTLTLHV